MEMLRKRSEKNLRSYNARERMQEGEEQAKVDSSSYPFFAVFAILVHYFVIPLSSFLSFCPHIIYQIITTKQET